MVENHLDLFESAQIGLLPNVVVVKVDLSLVVDGEVEGRLLGVFEGEAEGRADYTHVVGLLVLHLDLDGVGDRVHRILLSHVFPSRLKLVDHTLQFPCLADIHVQLGVADIPGYSLPVQEDVIAVILVVLKEGDD